MVRTSRKSKGAIYMNDKVQKLSEYIMAKNYGDIIYHQEIAE